MALYCHETSTFALISLYRHRIDSNTENNDENKTLNGLIRSIDQNQIQTKRSNQQLHAM